MGKRLTRIPHPTLLQRLPALKGIFVHWVFHTNQTMVGKCVFFDEKTIRFLDLGGNLHSVPLGSIEEVWMDKPEP